MPVYAFPPWTPTRESAVRALWDDGYSVDEISATTGFSVRRIYDRSDRRNWTRRKGLRSVLQLRNFEIKEEYASGISLRAIARNRKMSLSAVHKIINPAVYAR